MADEKIIFSVEVNNAEAVKAIENQTDKITELTNANERLRKEQKELDTSTKEGLDERKRLGQQIAQNNDQLKEERSERNRLIKVAKTQSNSLAALRQENAKLNKERANLNTKTKEGSKRFDELTKQIKKNKDAINNAEQAAGNFTGSVGDYEGAIKRAFESTQEMTKGLSIMPQQLSGLTDALSPVVSGFLKLPAGAEASSKGMGTFRKVALQITKIPIILLLSAIVAAVVGIGKALGQNEGFMNRFKEVLEGISNVVDEVVGRIGSLVKIAGKLFKGQITLNEAIEEGKDEMSGMGDAMKKAFDEGVELAKLQKQIEKNTIFNTTALAKLNAEYEKQSAIADDATRSFQEREAANKKAAEAARQAAQFELNAANLRAEETKKRVDQAIRQNKINNTLRQEQADAIAAQIAAEANLTRVIFENEKVRRELKQDDFEQELDFILDVADVRKTANEKLIADDKLTFAQRKQILQETNGFIDESFKQQIALFEQYGGISLDVNQLLKLNNKESFEYARGLGLSEIATNRLLEVIRERITAQSDLSEAAADLNEQQTEFIKQSDEELDEFFDKEMERNDASVDAFIDGEQKKTESLKSEQEKRGQLYTDAFLSLTNATAQFLTSEDASFKEFGKMLAASLLDQLQAVIIAKNTEILVKSLATADSIATFGATGGARAAAIIGLTTAAFGVAKAGLSKLADGGEVKTGIFGGRYHSSGGTTLSADGVPIAEVEKDERFFVVNRKDSAMIDQLSSINSIHGKSFSTPMRFLQDGGEVAAQSITAQQVVDIVRNTPIFVRVTDINDGQSIRANVINNGTV